MQVPGWELDLKPCYFQMLLAGKKKLKYNKFELQLVLYEYHDTNYKKTKKKEVKHAP